MKRLVVTQVYLAAMAELFGYRPQKNWFQAQRKAAVKDGLQCCAPALNEMQNKCRKSHASQ